MSREQHPHRHAYRGWKYDAWPNSLKIEGAWYAQVHQPHWAGGRDFYVERDHKITPFIREADARAAAENLIDTLIWRDTPHPYMHNLAR